MAITAAVVSTVAVVGGTVYSAQQQGKAAKAQRKAATLERRRQQLLRQRERSKAIRETRIAAARASQAAANQGVAGSSGALGGQGSIVSQGAANISFLDESGRLSDQASEQLGQARRFQARASTGATVAQLGGMALNANPTGTAALQEQIFGS